MTGGLESAIYEGRVRHRRFVPNARQFDYRLFMMYLDLDEIPEVMGIHPLWSTRRRSPARFRRADYLGLAEVPLRQAVADLVQERTGVRPIGPIRMLTHLRYWGRIENPVTFYYCFDRSGRKVQTVVAEVTNTPWGDRHAYVVEGGDRNGVTSTVTPKALHVSPLMGMDHEYELRFGTPGPKLPVHIASSRNGEPFFDATLNLSRTGISRKSLTGLLTKYPPMSFKVIAGIHWQALRSWLSGATFHKRPEARDLQESPETGMLCPVRDITRESSEPPAGKAAR